MTVAKIDMSTARVNGAKVNIGGGDYLAILRNEIGDLEIAPIVKGHPEDYIPIKQAIARGQGDVAYKGIFNGFMFKHTLTSSVDTEVFFGGEEQFIQSGLAPAKGLYELRSDKDTHFTGALAQNAIEQEDIAGLVANKIRITNIVIQSDQNLDWRLWFYSADSDVDTDLDLDDAIGFHEFASGDGVQIAGANQFYYHLSGDDLQDYIDEDESNELHLGLQNYNATGKNAGATGEVIVRIWYQVLE